MTTVFIEHDSSSPPGLALDVLRSHGHSIRIIRTHAGDEIPDSLDEIDAIISCGGGQSVLAPDSILEAEFLLLRAAHEAQVPVLGLCLGCQVLAHALGGTVGRLESGPEVGFHEIALTPTGREDPLFKGIPWWTPQFQWHEDFVETAPPGGRILGGSANAPVQAFAVGISSYGIQYHPEYTRSHVVDHCTRDDAFVRAGGGSEELARQTERHYNDCHRHALRFFESVALFLMPGDRLSEGRMRDPVEH